MGKYATRKTLKEYCSRAGITLYAHRLDGASFQFCAGGYVVNGYLGSRITSAELLYEMQKQLIFLLKYGSTNPAHIHYNDGTSIEWHKELSVTPSLAEPLCDHHAGKVYTLLSPKGDEELQDYFNLQKS